MPSHYGPKTTTDSLIVRLDPADKNSYPGSGTTVTDLTGNGHNGQLTTAPTFSTLAGGCFDHAAGTGQVVNINFSGNILSEDFIVEEAIPIIKEELRRGGVID